MRLTLLAILALLSGCVTMNESMLPKVGAIQPLPKTVLIETRTGELVQKLNGEGANRGVLSGTTVGNQVVKLIMGRWKSNGIVDDYGPAGELKAKPDYTLIVSGVRNEDSSIAGAVFSGLTFMLLPTTTTLTYDLNLELTDNKTGQKYQAKAKNAITSVMQILLLPALPFSWVGSKNAFDDIADYAYDEFRKQGAFAGGAKRSEPEISLRE
jgi:hypothetical protein